MLQTKTQSPWPVLRGALYDSYLAQTGGYWGVKRALRPTSLHVQLNMKTWEATVLNKGTTNYVIGEREILSVLTHLYTTEGVLVGTTRSIIKKKTIIEIGDVLVMEKVEWPKSDKLSGMETLLVSMSLLSSTSSLIDSSNAAGAVGATKAVEDDETTVIATNFYWSSDPSQAVQQYDDLGALRRNEAGWVDVKAKITRSSDTEGEGEGKYVVTVSLSKGSKKMAMFISLDLMRGTNDINGTNGTNVRNDNTRSVGDNDVDQRILPVWFSDNLICLLPGEERTLVVTTTSSSFRVDGDDDKVVLRVQGWNVNTIRAAIETTTVLL